jgi:delta 1-pyrroline-5-carboxylate dehydrogenase
VKPTLFTDVDNSMRIAREEIFGPVLSIIPYRDDDDAVAIANDTDYGLSALVLGADAQRAQRIAGVSSPVGCKSIPWHTKPGHRLAVLNTRGSVAKWGAGG